MKQIKELALSVHTYTQKMEFFWSGKDYEFHDFELIDDVFALVRENMVSIFNKDRNEVYYPSDFYSYLMENLCWITEKYSFFAKSNKQNLNNAKDEK